jgi:AcrR family transcriptional regulator
MKRSPSRKSAASTPPARASRSDGQVTREQLLATAGAVFAECGYAQTTSKAICERAKANVAAVNYHFGSKDGLYEAVLSEAHRQLIDMDDLSAWASRPGPAKERLGFVLGQILNMASAKNGWAFPVLLREMMSPSPVMPALALKTVRPKAQILIGLVAEVMALPPDHPSLQRCVFFCIIPCMLSAIAPPALKSTVLPAMTRDVDAFLSDLLTFAFAGMEAVARQCKAKPR